MQPRSIEFLLQEEFGPGGGTGNGSFSVAINGKTISGSAAIDDASLIIAANPTASFDSAGDIFVYLQIPGDSIGFHIPDRKGYTFYGVGTYAAFYGVVTDPQNVYVFDSAWVNISNLTSSRVSGTFGGRIATSLLSNQGTTAEMTSGTFDVPIIP